MIQFTYQFCEEYRNKVFIETGEMPEVLQEIAIKGADLSSEARKAYVNLNKPTSIGGFDGIPTAELVCERLLSLWGEKEEKLLERAEGQIGYLERLELKQGEELLHLANTWEGHSQALYVTNIPEKELAKVELWTVYFDRLEKLTEKIKDYVLSYYQENVSQFESMSDDEFFEKSEGFPLSGDSYVRLTPFSLPLNLEQSLRRLKSRRESILWDRKLQVLEQEPVEFLMEIDKDYIKENYDLILPPYFDYFVKEDINYDSRISAVIEKIRKAVEEKSLSAIEEQESLSDEELLKQWSERVKFPHEKWFSVKLASRATKLREKWIKTWINFHGSERLKKMHQQGYPCHQLYLTERAKLEYPGFVIDFEDKSDSEISDYPSLDALKVAEKYKESYIADVFVDHNGKRCEKEAVIIEWTENTIGKTLIYYF